jgi:carbonic anhydrase
MNKYWISITLLAIAQVLTSATAQAQDDSHYVSPWRTPWTYEGAGHWSDLDPLYAACSGKEQSPIDIRNAERAHLPALQFQSKTGPLKYVINNRYTIRVNYHPDNGNFLVVGNERYELVQFHFHHPSEEYVEGKSHEMEVHLMYKATDGKVAGVTVFVVPGAANPIVQQLWRHMPISEGRQAVAGVEINPAGLLPSELGGYYTYMGSLTAPPCTEGVTWFVLKTPIELSREQVDAFAKLYPDDARPLQPLNGRRVKETQ